MKKPAAPVQWPVLVGTIPILASAFQPRDGLRRAVDEARGRVVLSSDSSVNIQQSDDHRPVQVLSGGGGVGKSQLAAAYAREAIKDNTDLVLWTSANDVQQVLAAYAQAALLVQAPGRTGADLEVDAQAFARWLASTDRRWLIVLDDITNPDAIDPWWPDSQRGTGWVLATTRLKDPRLTGGGRVGINVDVYTPAEATSYLTTRLTRDGKAHLLDGQAPALTEALGCLPLALGHAAAHMLREGATCSAYLKQFTDRAARLDDLLPHWADTERYGRQVVTTLLIALEATDQDPHGRLARAALLVAALLDPTGHPHDLWATTPLLTYLAQQQSVGSARRILALRRKKKAARPIANDEARAALRLLDRYGLITYGNSADDLRAVRIHALTARAVRETITGIQRSAATTAIADALLHLWPDLDQTEPELASALRTSVDSLIAHAGDELWTPTHPHQVLFRAGSSLLDAGLGSTASAYWEQMAADCERRLPLGAANPNALTAYSRLAGAYMQVGRTKKAIRMLKRVATDHEQTFGVEHPQTVIARHNLAVCYSQSGRINEAIKLLKGVVAVRERWLGSEDPDTLAAQANLAFCYAEAGRISDAIAIEERVGPVLERLLGAEHRRTMFSRSNLASFYWRAGRTSDAIELMERVVADSERLLGAEHPDTLATRTELASSYSRAGRTSDAIELMERVVADTERLLGAEHPSTLATRTELASSYSRAGRTSDAIELMERVVADTERLLGAEHPQTRTASDALSQLRSPEIDLGQSSE
ncbi:tetratricopeptide repeat protein [Streptomyces sp. 6-11-2]|uniref:tetratricopeptide repeat protein n=1 Tax=Streptomyces sp. 6-11-2 TaxID=2585753 RepID=UPI001144BC78|nr:tetratricopeptide repeat protein [Streptomyces sp. 6-11-2]